MPLGEKPCRTCTSIPHKLVVAISEYVHFVNAHIERMRDYTPFEVSTQIVLDNIIFETHRQCPELLHDKEEFLENIAMAFDRCSLLLSNEGPPLTNFANAGLAEGAL